MPNPSSIAMSDEWADAEVVDAELAPELPTDLQVVVAAARAYAEGRQPLLSNALRRHVRAACDRLESRGN